MRLGQTTVRSNGVRIEDRYRQFARALSLLLAVGFARGDIASRRIVTALQLAIGFAGAPATYGIERLMTAAQSPSRCTPSATMQLGSAIRVARVIGHHVLHQAGSSLLAGRFARGNIVAGVIATL